MNRHLLILDLDETLVFATEDPLSYTPDFQLEDYSVYYRPYLNQFLAQVFDGFQVAVWSSAGTSYVQEVVELIFSNPNALEFIWSAKRCTQRYDAMDSAFYWIKNLKKVKRRGFNLDRVLMIDDTPQKLEKNYGNLIQVRPFEGDRSDTELRDLLPFLDSLRTMDNVRKVEKRHWRNSPWSKRLPPASPLPATADH
ncbi:MAG: HAD family hydrolase [Cyanobacteria bacterium P01_G01_bin.54]